MGSSPPEERRRGRKAEASQPRSPVSSLSCLLSACPVKKHRGTREEGEGGVGWGGTAGDKKKGGSRGQGKRRVGRVGMQGDGWVQVASRAKV